MKLNNLVLKCSLVLMMPFGLVNIANAEEESGRTIEEIVVISTKRAQGELSQDI
jgi:hypothetical protein